MTNTVNLGWAARRSAITGAASRTCSKLSRTSKSRRSCKSGRSRSAAPSAAGRRPEPVSDGSKEQRGIADGGEFDEGDSVEGPSGLLRRSDRQTCLPDTTGTGQGHEAHAGIKEEVACGSHLWLAADEWRSGLRELRFAEYPTSAPGNNSVARALVDVDRPRRLARGDEITSRVVCW